jgi:hypothetical protein
MQTSPAEYVIRKFGGLTGAANAIGKPVSTVQGWKDRGKIPQEYWYELIGEAAKRGERLELADFLDAPPVDLSEQVTQ